MGLPDHQPTLLPPEILQALDSQEQKNNSLLITIDNTPTYEYAFQADQIRRTSDPAHTNYFEPIEQSTSLDLVTPIQESKLMRKLGNSQQRFIEAVLGKSTLGHTNIVFDTPISTMAWLLYAKVIGSRFSIRDITTIINFQKALLRQYAPIIKRSNSIHIVQRIPTFQLLKNIPYISATETILLEERVEIFNSCLNTASRIASKTIGKKFEMT